MNHWIKLTADLGSSMKSREDILNLALSDNGITKISHWPYVCMLELLQNNFQRGEKEEICITILQLKSQVLFSVNDRDRTYCYVAGLYDDIKL